MNKFTVSRVVFLLFLVWSCGSPKSSDSGKDDEANFQGERTESTSEIQPEAEKSKETTIKAGFAGLEPIGNGEAIYKFRDESGTNYELFRDENSDPIPYLRLMRDAGNPAPVFRDKQFEISFEKKEKEVWSEERNAYENKEVPVINRISEIFEDESIDSQKLAIELSELQETVFFGTSAGKWSLEFQKEQIMFQPDIDEEKQSLQYQTGGGMFPKVNPVSDEEVRVLASDLGGYEYTFIIRKETCSDGMSANEYPYSIHVVREGGEGYKDDLGTGCGRITKK